MRLPRSVQEIAEVIGVERALFLIGQLPKCRAGLPGKESIRPIMYVPKSVKPNDRLVQILGWNDAQKIVRAFGGEILQPANCSEIYRRFRDATIVRMVRQDGADPSAVAELMGVTSRHVRNVLKEIPQQEIKAANDNHRHSATIKLRGKKL
jgi:hypothetical protein